MATLFRRKYTKLVDGKRVKKQSQKWYTKLRYPDGVVRTIPLFHDKVASHQRAAQLHREIELAESGVIDKFKEHRAKPLGEHLRDYQQALLDKGVTRDYAMLIYGRVETILQVCRFVFLRDVEAAKVQGYIAEAIRAGLSTKSGNHYLAAIKGFFNWMRDDRRMAENPLAHLKAQNAKKDIRRQRRALMLHEIDALLSTTLTGSRHHNMTGRERYMLYALALSTGFRAGELSSLLWRSLDLDESEPFITVLAEYAKNGKEATLPLRKEIAGLFRRWYVEEGFSLADKVFPGFNKDKAAAMLRKDLAAAGIAYQDNAGRYADFHSLRHTFISNVGKSGATVKEAQMLARHSTVALTLDVYTHIGLNDERRAIESLPRLHSPDEKGRAVALKTGTDDGPVRVAKNGQEQLTPKLTPFLTPTAFSEKNQSATIGNERDDLGEDGTSANCVDNRHLDNENDCSATVGVGVDSRTPVQENNGGGGNRTRVPRHFSRGIYVRS